MVAIAATSTAALTDDAIIAVPETVYMEPSTGASTTVKYYVNNTISNSINGGKTVVTPDVTTNTKGYVQLYIPGAVSFTYSVSAVKGGIGDVKVSGEGTAQSVGSNGAAALNETTISISGTGLNAGNTALAEWKFTVTMNDGTTRIYYAYTTLYSPWYQPVAAATRAYAKLTKPVYASSILWVSGVHSSSKGSALNEQYPKTDAFLPMLNLIKTPSNNNPDGWVQTGSNGLAASASYNSSESNNYHRYTSVISPTAYLTVDTSRYNNFSQIPNFTVGFMVTDTEKSDGANYYAADYTGKTDDFENAGDGGGSKYDGIYNRSTGAKFVTGSDNSTAVKYNGVWNKEIVTGDVRLKSALHTYRNGTINTSAWSYNFVQMNVTGVNKAALRQFVIECASLNANNYTTASWNNLQAELRNAAENLGNPVSATISTDSLKTARDNLKVNVTFNANTGSISATSEDVTIGANKEVSFTPSVTASKKGYTFAGWSKDGNATTGSKTFNVNLYDTNKKYYAIFQPDTHLLFDTILDMGKWDYSATSGAAASGANGIALTNNNSSGEKTLVSNLFAVEAGKSYYINTDVTGDAWDVYIFFYDDNTESGLGIDFSDSNNHFSSSSNDDEARTFTAPAGATRAVIRLDANNPGTTVVFNDIRVYEAGKADNAVDFGTANATFKSLKGASTYGELPVPAKANYDFVGWYTAGGTKINAEDSVAVSTSTTVYSKWTPTTYTVTFDANGGNAVSSVTYNVENSSSKKLPSTTKTGYTFSHWEVVTAAGNWSAGSTINSGASLAGKNGNVTLKAVYTNNKYTLNFNLNKPAGAVTEPECSKPTTEVTFDNAIGELPVPSVNGYTFAGWFTAKTGGTQVTKDTVYTTAGSSSIYAKWNTVTYNITVDSNGGSSVSGSQFTIENGRTPAASALSGYAFSHWEVVSASGNWVVGETLPADTAFAGKYGDVTLKAVWASNEYKLYFNTNKPAGAITDPECEVLFIEVLFNNKLGTLPVPSVIGYEFEGWFTDADAQVTADTIYNTVGDTTVYAKWLPVVYNLVTDENTGEAIADSTYTIENGQIPSGGAKTGYTFSHWEVAENSGNWVAGTAYNAGSVVTGKYGDVTLKAIWTANDYTLSFVTNDADSVSSAVIDKTQITVTYDSALNANDYFPVITRNGYTFNGWFTAPEGGEKVEVTDIYTTAGNTTVYAQWSIIEYKISFDVNEGSAAIADIVYNIESSIQLPEASQPGHTFSKWINRDTQIGKWISNATYNANKDLGKGFYGNITLTPIFTINEYTITWIIDGKTEIRSFRYNQMPTHETPVKAADERFTYEFAGWSPALERVSGDAIYKATFNAIPRKFTVNWVADGEIIDTMQIGFGEAIPQTDKAVPSKTGHTGAWPTAPSAMPANDVTIEAVYTPIKYKITWVADGNVIGTSMVDYGTIPSFDGTPVKEKDAEYTYTFSKWSPELVAVTGEASYTAEFSKTPNVYTITWVADGTTVETTSVAFGSAITAPEVPAKIGFVGSWENVPETMPAESIRINAKYVKGSLVTWYLDDGSIYYQYGFATGEQIVFDRSNPTKAADAEYTYTFSHWSETPGGAAISGYPVASEDDFTYYAVYDETPNEYMLVWIADGRTIESKPVAFGTAITAPELPAKTGHTGVWLGLETLKTMPAKNTVVYAEYTPNNYTITWVVAGKSYETTFAYGTMPEFTGSTNKASSLTEDYTFAGWDNDVTAVVGEAKYTATYTVSARKYTVTWKYEDGTVIDTFKVANGAAITEIPEIAAKEGHDAVYNIPAVMPTNDIEIVVTYEAKSYTITWETPSGSIEETWKYGETPSYNTGKYGVPSKESTPEREYTFSTWSPSVGVVKGDATYTALFVETSRKYTVVWYVDGKFQETRDIAYGSVIPALSIPEKEGYTASWDNTYRTMPAKDLVINAVYTAKIYTVYWKVDGLTVYSASVSFGSAIPSQKVPEKLGCTGTWVNVPATMPAQNITINAEYAPKTYNVTWRFDGVSTNGTATYGEDFVITFTGDELPEELKITVGGVAIAADGYTYSVLTGTLTIKGAAITGDILVVARAAGGNCNLIANLFGGESTNNADVIPERQVYFTILVPYEGYLLPADVSIYVDGVYLAEGYTYDSETGKLVINAEVVYGEIEIFADFPVDPTYGTEKPDAPSTNCGCNCHSSNAFLKFFFDIITFLRQIFGMEQYRYCDCGAAHW